MKIYKIQNHKYFTTFGAVIHLGTLKRVEGVDLKKAEIIEATEKEFKRIDDYLEKQAMEFEMGLGVEEEETVYSPHYYDSDGNLYVR